MKEVKKMNPYILSLEHKQASLEMVGGKGMSLSKLLTAGIPVPDGFHVTTASYRILRFLIILILWNSLMELIWKRQEM